MTIVNINVSNDSDFNRAFVYKDATLTPIDLTGASLYMRLRAKMEDATVSMELSIPAGSIILTDPVNGLFQILIHQVDLERLTTGAYYQSLIWLDTDGSKQELWHGSFTNNAGASR
jgi:hypothetical protein